MIWCTTSQPKLSSLSYTTRKTRKNVVVSKVDFEQRKNGQNMTFLVHHSGGTESLKQVGRGLPSTSSRVPSEARISWAGTSSGLKTNKRWQLRTDRVVTILIPDQQFATPPHSTWRRSVQDLLVNETTKSSQVCTTKHSPPDCCLIFRVASSAFRIILL